MKPRATPSKCRDNEDAHTSHQLGVGHTVRQVTGLACLHLWHGTSQRRSAASGITAGSSFQSRGSRMCLILLWLTSPLSRVSYSSGLALWNKLEFFDVCYVSLVLFLRQSPIYRVLTVDHTDLKLTEIHLLYQVLGLQVCTTTSSLFFDSWSHAALAASNS